MTMQQMYPSTAPSIDPMSLYDDLTLLPARPYRPSVALNMVTTVDGKAAIGGRASAIGSAVDHLAMRKIRAAAHCVLLGAGTLRAEGVDPRVPPELGGRRIARGLPAQPIAAIVSASGDLPLNRRLFRLSEIERLVITSAALPADRRHELERYATVLAIGEPEVDLRAALGLLQQAFGVQRLVAEGGPRLNDALLRADLVDELFWTIAPAIVSGTGPTMVVGEERPPDQVRRATLVSAFVHESELFLRYRLVGVGGRQSAVESQ
ncbi:MAG: dihydrofolate reductase family protein [Chloroflexi bacterium]|nr:dihydrofolate reductase family protein [Chloroflexota bacterium]